jgi:hypothetical protein
MTPTIGVRGPLEQGPTAARAEPDVPHPRSRAGAAAPATALATTALEHSAPGGMVTGPGLAYQLLTADGVAAADAGFVVVGEAIGSAVVLNVLLWLALLASVPVTGVRPLELAATGLGLAAMAAVGLLLLTFTRGERRAVHAVRWLGHRLPRVGADRLERAVRHVGTSVTGLTSSRAALRRAALWAALNWLLDAASL